MAGIEQQANLVGNALADNGRFARRIGFGLGGQRRDAVEMPGKDRAECGALAAPRLLETGKGSLKRRQDGGIGRGARLVALQNLGRFEHTAQRQQSVGARRCDAELVDQPAR